MLDFRIATFLQLCETKSYTKTARLLGMTQPSVTQHIKYLQKKYQCTLFTYEGKSLRLTSEGEYLRRQAEAMTKMSKRVTSDLKRMSEQNAVLRFGFPAELGEKTGAALAAELMQQDPELVLSVHVGTMPELVKMAENGELDFVLTDKAYVSPTLVSAPMGKAKFGCFTAASQAGESIHIKQLLQQNLLLREADGGDRVTAELLLRKKNLVPEDFASVLTSNSGAVLHQMTAAGRGVCFAYAAAMDADDTVMLSLGDLTDERNLTFLYRKDAVDQTGYKNFFETFKQLWDTSVQ